VAQKITQAKSSKSDKVFPVTEDTRRAERVVQVPQDEAQTSRQEYPEVRAAIERGLADVAAGRVHRMSFAEYADLPTED